MLDWLHATVLVVQPIDGYLSHAIAHGLRDAQHLDVEAVSGDRLPCKDPQRTRVAKAFEAALRTGSLPDDAIVIIDGYDAHRDENGDLLLDEDEDVVVGAAGGTAHRPAGLPTA